jgi:hypothetical protein
MFLKNMTNVFFSHVRNSELQEGHMTRYLGISLLYSTSDCTPLKNTHSMSLIPSLNDHMALYGIFLLRS